MSVTYLDVEQAIASLLEHKKSLTLANLRQALGDRGSMSTLTKYLQQWKTQRYIDPAKISTPIVPPAPDSIFSAVQTVWQQMQGIGDRQLAEKEMTFELQRQAWQEEKEALSRELAENKQALQSYTQDLLKTREERESFIMKLANLTEQHHLLQQRFEDGLQSQVVQKAIYEQMLDKLSTQNHSLTVLHQKSVEDHSIALAAQKGVFEQTIAQAQKQADLQYQTLLQSYQQEQIKLALAAQRLQDSVSLSEHFQTFSAMTVQREEEVTSSFVLVKEELKALAAQYERLKGLEPGYPFCNLNLVKERL